MKQKKTNKEAKKTRVEIKRKESQGPVGSDSNLYTEHGEMWLVL